MEKETLRDLVFSIKHVLKCALPRAEKAAEKLENYAKTRQPFSIQELIDAVRDIEHVFCISDILETFERYYIHKVKDKEFIKWFYSLLMDEVNKFWELHGKKVLELYKRIKLK